MKSLGRTQLVTALWVLERRGGRFCARSLCCCADLKRKAAVLGGVFALLCWDQKATAAAERAAVYRIVMGKHLLAQNLLEK